MIYLDNAASTPLCSEALDAMTFQLGKVYANPSSIHRSGRDALRMITLARTQIAELIGATPSEIIFTSGGTESNNMAILGVGRTRQKSHIITTEIEHDAVIKVCKRLETEGHTITYVRAGNDGLIDPIDIVDAITSDTVLVSVMTANNEVGTVQDIAFISSACNDHKILFHTDAVQAVGKIPLDVSGLKIDMMSFSSHKINGPKGVGALYIKKGTVLDSLVYGGGQEQGLRSGTENVSSIVGFGAACKAAKLHMAEDSKRVLALRKHIVEGVSARITHSLVNGDIVRRLPGNAHFTFLGISGEDLIIKLDECGVAASTGSACSVHTQKESHVLRAMGLGKEAIDGSLRITIGVHNTLQEIDSTLDILESCVAELRRVSPFKEKYGF